MRKFIFLISILSCCTLVSTAQITESQKAVALDILQKNLSATGFSQTEMNNSIITHTYIVDGSNVRMVYLQQSHLGIPVYNQLHVMAFKNGILASNTGSRVPDITVRTNNINPNADITPETAIQSALSEIGVITNRTVIPQKVSADGRKFEYDKLDIATENITAELIWFPVKESNDVKLVWQVFIAPKNSSDYWLIRIDAKTGQYIHKQTLTDYCNWDGEDPHDGKQSTKEAGLPTGQAGIRWGAGTKAEIASRQDMCHKKTVQVETPHNQQSPYVVNNSDYRVVPYPAESPIHPGGAHALMHNPWSIAPGNATSLGWHYDGAAYYQNTRGNNVYAYEDRNADNLPGASGVSSTGQPDLLFDFTPNYGLEPTVTSPPNQQFNITNLFYWNNVIHDLAYIYGFTESARNFQNNNQSLGGAGADYVLAEAQDGGGSNNANFATPPDGSRPRMQMYLWTAPTPDLDGDVDNGIIIHEYAHGISNRLTGSGSGCLSNAEQMGEGWSDYLALMMTHDWASALPGDGFSNPRGIGTYAKNQPITGPGIRQYRYTTDMSINPMTYSNLPTVVHPHGTGTIWCTVLWDMTWAIIQQAGINPSLHNLAGNGGNAIALKLVMEGMRLQPCSPGFISGRDAILQADQMYFGGQYHCIIMDAFARRGMGEGASQGSSGSRTDQIVSFTTCGGTPTPCNVPTGLASSGVTETTALVSWDAVSGAATYNMDYKKNSSSTWIIGANATTGTSVYFTGLSPATLYDWRVRTNCTSNSSAYAQSQFTTVTPVNTCPGEYDVNTNGTTTGAAVIPFSTDIKGLLSPSGDQDHYKFTLAGSGSVNLTLTNLPANYELRLLNSGGSKIAESHKTGTNNESITKSVSAGTYYALVYPKNSANHATLCYTLRVTAGAPGAIEEDDADADGFGEILVTKGISVFPNPVNNDLVVTVPDIKGLATISVIDVYGRALVRKNTAEVSTRVNVAGLSAGLYVVRVMHNGNESSLKVVKQ